MWRRWHQCWTLRGSGICEMVGFGQEEEEEKAPHVEAPQEQRPLRCGTALGTR